MSRRHRAQKREVLPDPKFGDLIVTKFMNYVMYEGKKAVAENIVYGAFDILADKKKEQTAVETFHNALDNVAPSVEVRSRRVGGATYQVPVEVRPDRRRALAIRWLVNAARVTELRPEKSGDYAVRLGDLEAPLSRRFPEALARLRG